MESLVICSSLAVSTASYRLALTGLPIQLALSGFRKIQDKIPDLALISFRSVPGEKEEQAGRSLALAGCRTTVCCFSSQPLHRGPSKRQWGKYGPQRCRSCAGEQ